MESAMVSEAFVRVVLMLMLMVMLSEAFGLASQLFPRSCHFQTAERVLLILEHTVFHSCPPFHLPSLCLPLYQVERRGEGFWFQLMKAKTLRSADRRMNEPQLQLGKEATAAQEWSCRNRSPRPRRRSRRWVPHPHRSAPR